MNNSIWILPTPLCTIQSFTSRKASIVSFSWEVPWLSKLDLLIKNPCSGSEFPCWEIKQIELTTKGSSIWVAHYLHCEWVIYQIKEDNEIKEDNVVLYQWIETQ